jgi:hypothetical protein
VIYWPQEDAHGIIEKTAAVSQTECLDWMDDAKFAVNFENSFGLQDNAVQKTIECLRFAFDELYEQNIVLKTHIEPSNVPRLLIIDTWAAVTAGMDKNSAKDMGNALKALKQLQSALNCTVFIVHHSSKDSSKGLRGHSGIHAAADNVWRITKRRNMHIVEVMKVKHHSGDKRFGFEIGSVDVVFENAGIKKLLPFCDPLSVESVKQFRVFNKTEQLVLNQLAELSREGLVSVSRRQLSDALEGADGVSNAPVNRKKSVDRAVSSLLSASILLETDSGVSLPQDNIRISNDNFSANNGTDRDTPL